MWNVIARERITEEESVIVMKQNSDVTVSVEIKTYKKRADNL